ncbi:MAG: hypothetical protein OER77_17140 [Myxococcales bacterium]|nr:hypothetical protein [Myxococcales bacterium]
MPALSRRDIERLLELLNNELRSASVKGEVYLVGGAVMCLAFGARESTRDVDGYFEPTKKIREAATRVALASGIDERWLNDGVKGYLSERGSFSEHLELSNLKVFCADANYLLAMKCLAMRIGEEFQDLDDVRYLLRHIGIRNYEDALAVIANYYPLDRFPQKTLYALEELLEDRSSPQ